MIDSDDKNYTAGRQSAKAPVERSGTSKRIIIFIAIVLFLAGVVAGGWLMARLMHGGAAATNGKGLGDNRAMADIADSPYVGNDNPNRIDGALTASDTAPQTEEVAGAEGTESLETFPNSQAVRAQQAHASEIFANQALAQRVAVLERQLATLRQKDASGSNGKSYGRTEGVVIAIAVRRAIERGRDLGDLDYLENQLQQHFGVAQPNAVAIILAVARNPIPHDALYAAFDQLTLHLTGESATLKNASSPSGDVGFWRNLQHKFTGMFTIRPAHTPVPDIAHRMARARQYLVSDRIAAAIEEIEALPNTPQASDWLTTAHRYHNVRRALDVIEAAAIGGHRDVSAHNTASADNSVAAR